MALAKEYKRYWGWGWQGTVFLLSLCTRYVLELQRKVSFTFNSITADTCACTVDFKLYRYTRLANSLLEPP